MNFILGEQAIDKQRRINIGAFFRLGNSQERVIPIYDEDTDSITIFRLDEVDFGKPVKIDEKGRIIISESILKQIKVEAKLFRLTVKDNTRYLVPVPPKEDALPSFTTSD